MVYNCILCIFILQKLVVDFIINFDQNVASLCGSAYNDRAVVWRGEWGGPRHSCVRWKSTCLKGKGCFCCGFWHRSAFSSNTLQWRHTDTLTYSSIIDSRVKNWQYFRRTHGIPFNSDDVVRFQIEVGVEEKFMCKNVRKQMQHVHCDSSDKAALCGGHMHDLDLTVNMLGCTIPVICYSSTRFIHRGVTRSAQITVRTCYKF